MLTERAGFEPADGFKPVTDLANRRFRPLSHLSPGLGLGLLASDRQAEKLILGILAAAARRLGAGRNGPSDAKQAPHIRPSAAGRAVAVNPRELSPVPGAVFFQRWIFCRRIVNLAALRDLPAHKKGPRLNAGAFFD
jgi:hypothetical protein